MVLNYNINGKKASHVSNTQKQNFELKTKTFKFYSRLIIIIKIQLW